VNAPDKWVLVTDGHTGESRDSLTASRALVAAGYKAAVTLSTRVSLATASRACSHRVRVPFAWEPGYVEAIRAELASPVRNYVTYLPTSEAALLALGTQVPDLLDKTKLAERASAVGVSSPQSLEFATTAELLEAAESLDYPIVVKPQVRRRPASYLSSPEELRATDLGDGPHLVQRFLTDQMGAVSGVMWHGDLVAAVHERWLRLWPHPCGLASAAETVEPDADLERRLAALLDGYDGIFHAQFAGQYLLDLNLRVHTSHPLGVAAGVNLVGIYVGLMDGAEPMTVRARPRARFRWIEGDLRNVGRRLRQKKIGLAAAGATLKPRRGTAHSTESLKDPLPTVIRLGHAARRALR
jgi:predicted ATP-grasp superfamily ATP-dependent carboligase